MTNGKINVRKFYDGYVLIQNGGGNAAFNFLKANRVHFDHVRLNNLETSYAIKSERLPKFKAYAEKHGLTVIEVGA